MWVYLKKKKELERKNGFRQSERFLSRNDRLLMPSFRSEEEMFSGKKWSM